MNGADAVSNFTKLVGLKAKLGAREYNAVQTLVRLKTEQDASAPRIIKDNMALDLVIIAQAAPKIGANVVPTSPTDLPMRKPYTGFTLIETMVVIAIIAILALVAMPSYQGKIVRDQIIEGSALASIAKAPISAYWTAHKAFPADNASVALPAADRIVNNLVRAVMVQDGVIHITYGNRANRVLQDKTLSLRPAVMDDAPVVPVAWVCGSATGPDKMTIRGENKTDISKEFLPMNCR